MATIPLQIAQRRLDTGNAVQYPNGSPVGRAMQGFGDELSAVAERYRQMKERQDAFDAEIARRRFNGRIAQAEDEVTANAPADGSGLHDAMYGQVDPRTGRVVKIGLFDTMFDDALQTMPESQRAAFASQKEATRAPGSLRMAARQQARRDDYELAELTEVGNISTSAIAKGNPNDIGSFEAIRQSGFDLIAKIGNPLIRQAAEATWRGNTAKALVQAMIAQDPKRAAEMLGTAQTGSRTKNGSAGAVGEQQGNVASAVTTAVQSAGTSSSTPVGGLPSDRQGAPVQQAPAATTDNVGQRLNGSKAPSEKGDRAGKATPDERVAQAFQNHNSAQPDGKVIWAEAPWIADLRPGDLQDLGQRAQATIAAQLFDARTNVELAYQNAPDDLMYTGNYSGKKPDDGDFAAVYGVDEGGKQSLDLQRTFKVGLQAFDMLRMPKDAIDAAVLAATRKPDSATPEQDQAQFEITVSAAKRVLQARAAAPADFARKIDPTADVYWKAVSSEDSYDPAGYQKAIARSVAVQLQLGIKNIQPLPQSIVKNLVDTLNDENVPQRERDAILRDLFAGTSDPGVQAAMALQLANENQARIARAIANNSVPVSAEERVNRNLAAFDALPTPLKPLVALNDTVRLMADGATFGYADKFAALMNSLISGSNYEEQLVAQRAGTQDAQDRAGYAGTAAEILGGYLSGRALGQAGITLVGRFGTAAMEGLPGFLARTGLLGVEGAVYGTVEATGRDQPISSGAASGAFSSAGSNVLGEGLGAAYRLAADWSRRRATSFRRSAEPATAEIASDSTISGAGPSSPVGGHAPTNKAPVGQDLGLTYMPHWNAAQRAAADLKVKMLTEAVTVVSRAVRVGTSARKIFKRAGFLIPFGNDIDHIIDLQLGGLHQLSNFAILDSSVNRSLGKQIHDLIKNLPVGTVINKVTIGER
ncbi:hypothetical protein [Mesorhizobium sophorae]|uniref:hypothetical protein n=1 Tax=Mesorhizobium sophorae TaxID=1300294 RepID=UPI00197F013E|nr:hypothetical protein [Mesorhizobium sophorae]